jgi:hypothetical protein
MIFFLKEKPASGTHISVAGFSSLKIAEKRLKKQKIIYIKEVFPMSNTPNPVYEKLMKCYESFRSQIDFQPEVALILGSGLGDFANDIRVTATLDYHDIEGFPVSTVPGHAGRFIFGYVGDVPVVCMQGRVHYYEGYPFSRPAS